MGLFLENKENVFFSNVRNNLVLFFDTQMTKKYSRAIWKGAPVKKLL